jgi:serine/threonine-protein kinase
MANPVQPVVGGLRFEVLAEIAVGTTARVDLCRTTAPVPGQLIAVKRLVAETAADPAVSSRFLDEVWMTSALRHPNVVSVVGWGNDDDGAYLAVELVQGVSLARLMKTVFDTREDFPERLVVYVGLCVLRGLLAAHELVSDRGEPLGLVHRDLSVHNVLVGFNGDVKIADFGLAKAKNRLTQTTSSLPTRAVGHLSPEELRGEPLDNRADLYSVGVMLYELLTKKPPFVGKDELDTARLITTAPTPDPVRVRPRIDMALAALVRRCLEKSPDARYRSARDILRELDGWLYAHGYRDDNAEALGRFVRRNAMRQMRWFERVISGQKEPTPHLPQAMGEGPAQAAGTAASATNRDTETTVVDAAKKPKLPPRRARSSDAIPAVKKRRDFIAEPTRREGFSSRADIALDAGTDQDDDEDEGEDIPTVAMKRGDHPAFRALMEARAAGDPARAPAEPRPADPPRGAPPAPAASERTDPRATVPLHESSGGPIIQDAASEDVLELPDDPSTVTPPPRRSPTQAMQAPSREMARPEAPRIANPGAPARIAPPLSQPPPLPAQPVRPQAQPPRPVPQTSAKPAPVSAQAMPPVHGFSREPSLRPATRAVESATTYDPGRTMGALSESTQPLSTHSIGPEYLQHQVAQLREDAAQKSREARRLRELADRAARDAELAEAAARKAERAASLGVEAIRVATSEGMNAATKKLEEALAVAEST